METNKTILMREVVAIGEKKSVGAVRDVRVDCDSGVISHYIIADFNQAETHILPHEKVWAVGDTFITIGKEADFLPTEGHASKELTEKGCSIVGVEVYSKGGNRIGSVSGFEFDPEKGNIVSIILADGSKYLESEILFFSPRFIFVENDKPEIEAEEGEESKPVAVPISEIKEEKFQEEVKSANVLSDEDRTVRDLLVGKKLADEVKSENGKFILAKGEVITDEAILKAKENDALLLLTVSVEV